MGQKNLLSSSLPRLKFLWWSTTKAAVSSLPCCRGDWMSGDMMGCHLAKKRNNQTLNTTQKINGNSISQHLLGFSKSWYMIPWISGVFNSKRSWNKITFIVICFTVFQVKDTSLQVLLGLDSCLQNVTEVVHAPGLERECAILYSDTAPSILGLKNALTYYISAKQYYLSSGCKSENKALKLPGQRHAE